MVFTDNPDNKVLLRGDQGPQIISSNGERKDFQSLLPRLTRSIAHEGNDQAENPILLQNDRFNLA